MEDIIEGSRKGNGERQYGLGVDVIRWFVASREDPSQRELVRISPQDIDQMNSEINFIRRCFRELFMHLNHEFPKQYYIDLNDLSFIHDFIHTNLILFLYNVTKAYETYDFSKVYRLILDFVKTYVWDIYLQGTKNYLISNPLDKDSFTIIYMYKKICENLLIILAPILCHNSQNIYEYFSGAQEKNIFQCKWPTVSDDQIETIIDRIIDYQILLELRSQLYEKIEKNSVRLAKDVEKLVKTMELVFVYGKGSKEHKILKLIGKDNYFFFGFDKITLESKSENEKNEKIAIISFKCKIMDEKKKQPLEFIVKTYQIQTYKCFRCWKNKSKKKDELCEDCESYLKSHQLRIEEII